MIIKKQPFISVIIPVYNIEKYIATCLQSVVMQSLSNIEIIVVNDASTDNSFSIINEFANRDNRIKVINNVKNVGLSATRNIGFKEANGYYIHFLDGDDYIAPFSYQELYEYAILNQLDILVFGEFRVFKNRNKVYNINYKLRSYKKVIFSTPADKQFLLNHSVGVLVGNKIYKKSFLLKNNLTFKEGYIFEDVLFYWQTLILGQKISFLNIPFYYYVQREGSITKSKDREDDDIFKIMEYSYKFLNVNNFLSYYGEVFTKKLLKTYIHFYKKVKRNKKREFFIKIQQSLKKMKGLLFIQNNNLVKRLVTIQNSSFAKFKLYTKIKLLR